MARSGVSNYANLTRLREINILGEFRNEGRHRRIITHTYIDDILIIWAPELGNYTTCLLKEWIIWMPVWSSQ